MQPIVTVVTVGKQKLLYLAPFLLNSAKGAADVASKVQICYEAIMLEVWLVLAPCQIGLQRGAPDWQPWKPRTCELASKVHNSAIHVGTARFVAHSTQEMLLKRSLSVTPEVPGKAVAFNCMRKSGWLGVKIHENVAVQ